MSIRFYNSAIRLEFLSHEGKVIFFIAAKVGCYCYFGVVIVLTMCIIGTDIIFCLDKGMTLAT